jgi:hypothetical protein
MISILILKEKKENRKKSNSNKYFYKFILKQLIFSLIICILSVLNSDIISSPIEKLTPNTCKVFEPFEYEIEKLDGFEFILPPIGDIPSEKEDISIGEVLSHLDKDRSVVIKFRIFQSGSFNIPVSWKNLQTNEIIQSKLKMEIVSSLSKDDNQQPAKMDEPIEFGKFLWYKLIFVILFCIGLVYLIYFLYKYYQKRPLDAILEIPNELTMDDILDAKWNQFISNQTNSKKQFAYLLTEMLQKKLQFNHKSFQTKKDLNELVNTLDQKKKNVLQQAMITDTILLEKIYQTLPIDLAKIREMKVFLLISKYTSNSETIEKHEAEQIYFEWKNLMNSVNEEIKK